LKNKADPDTRRVRRELLDWFATHKRDLPWRRTRDPYAVLLSEVMLQQTRVETVTPYFERFMRRFPTMTALASADVDHVLELWSGLGYYRRARMLWLAAREVVARFGGELPADRSALESLPGIGPYSAGAIASIAYGKREALVDGNVARVLSRLHAIEHRVGSKESAKRCWALARELVDGDEPGDLNQALMELGATICTPKSPRCAACPVRESCVAAREGRTAKLPLPKLKRSAPTVELDAFVVRHSGEVLLAKRPIEGLFGGLWEAPTRERGPSGSAPNWLASLGGEAQPLDGEIEHVLTHRVLRIRVFVLDSERRADVVVPGYSETAWTKADGAGAALSTLARKVLTVASRSSKTGGDGPRLEAPRPRDRGDGDRARARTRARG
jgi:A/G-specific adenine glycosylase